MIKTKIMERDKLEISKEEALQLVWGEHDTSKYEIISNKVVKTSRWSIYYDIVIKTLSDGRYWKDGYSEGATESQDESPYEYTEPDFREVFPKTIEVVVYE